MSEFSVIPTKRGVVIESRFANTTLAQRIGKNPQVQLVVYAGSEKLEVVLRARHRDIGEIAKLMTDTTCFIIAAMREEEKTREADDSKG